MLLLKRDRESVSFLFFIVVVDGEWLSVELDERIGDSLSN